MKKRRSFVAAFSAAACGRCFVLVRLSTLVPQPSTVLAQGINLTGNAARVDSNHLSNNGGYGIKAGVTNGSNLIIRNSVGNNSNGTGAYNIAPGNKDANRLSIGSNFSSTDPWANFSF